MALPRLIFLGGRNLSRGPSSGSLVWVRTIFMEKVHLFFDLGEVLGTIGAMSLRALTFKNGRWVALILAYFFLGGIGFSQKEQWLKFRPVSDDYGVRGVTVLVTTNLPVGLVPPKESGTLAFFRWCTALDGKARWFCFPIPPLGGTVTKLYIDKNANGRLDDDAPELPVRSSGGECEFGPFKIQLSTPDGPVVYVIGVVIEDRAERASQGPRWLPRIFSAGVYQGKVDFGGKKVLLTLIDCNANGVFNDTFECPEGPDMIAIDEGSSLSESDMNERPLSRYIEVGGGWYELEVAPDGAWVKVRKAEGLQWGTIQVPVGVTELKLIGENGKLNLRPQDGIGQLPVGMYEIMEYEYSKKDSAGVNWRVKGWFKESVFVRVQKEVPGSLRLGEPITLALSHEALGEGRVRFELDVQGPLEERVMVYRGKQQSVPPRLAIFSADGVFAVTNTLEYG